MSHDLKQSFTMVIGFIIGFTLAIILMPANLALAITSGMICGVLSGMFSAQVNYGDVFWHVGHLATSAGGVKQPLAIPKMSAANVQRTRYSSSNRSNGQADSRAIRPDRKKRSTNSFTTTRFHAMITGSNARQKKNFQNEKAYWISHLRAQNFIPGRQEQQGRRYQRRVKPREGLRIES